MKVDEILNKMAGILQKLAQVDKETTKLCQHLLEDKYIMEEKIENLQEQISDLKTQLGKPLRKANK